jgi:hypothetical protein
MVSEASVDSCLNPRIEAEHHSDGSAWHRRVSHHDAQEAKRKNAGRDQGKT